MSTTAINPESQFHIVLLRSMPFISYSSASFGSTLSILQIIENIASAAFAKSSFRFLPYASKRTSDFSSSMNLYFLLSFIFICSSMELLQEYHLILHQKDHLDLLFYFLLLLAELDYLSLTLLQKYLQMRLQEMILMNLMSQYYCQRYLLLLLVFLHQSFCLIERLL